MLINFIRVLVIVLVFSSGSFYGSKKQWSSNFAYQKRLYEDLGKCHNDLRASKQMHSLLLQYVHNNCK